MEPAWMSEYLIYLPFVLITAGTLLQIYIRLSAWRMRGRRVAADPGMVQLESLLPGWQSRPRLLLYFSSAWCGPCTALGPVIDRINGERGEEQDRILKLDALTHGDLATALGARGAPAFVLLEQGVVSKVHLGSLGEGTIRRMLRGDP